MALKFMLEEGDKVVIPEAGLTVDVLFIGNKVQLAFDAPLDITINAVFADSSKMFKNKKKNAQ